MGKYYCNKKFEKIDYLMWIVKKTLRHVAFYCKKTSTHCSKGCLFCFNINDIESRKRNGIKQITFKYLILKY